MAGATGTAVEAESRRGRVFPAFALVGWRWIARNPISAIVPILMPFFFLYFLRLISPPDLFPLQVAGAMLFTTQNVGNWCLGDAANWRLEQRLQDVFVASPLDKLRYLIGIAFSNFVPAAPALVMEAVLLAYVMPVPPLAWPVIALCVFVIWVTYSSIGLAISSRLKSPREIWPIGNLVFTTLGILSPLYFPIWILPPAWQAAARFLPTTYAALLVQGVLGLRPGATAWDMALDAALLVVSAAIGLAIALWLYRWREV